MKSLAPKKALLGLLLACLSTGFVTAQSMSFTVTTKTYGGSYATDGLVFALWITNSTSTYIKTINRQSKSYTDLLTNWKSNSGNKTADGITGASLPSHNYAYTSTAKTTSRIPFTWNFKDFNGNLVPDGNYYINIEFSEGGASKYIKYPLTKGTTSYSIVPVPVAASTYFTSPALIYTAPTVALTTTQVTNFDFTYTPSDRNLQLEYDAANHTGIQLQLVNLKGQTVYHTPLKGFGKETTQLPACPQGIYLIRLTDKEGWSQTQKLLL
jgi:hypothetical protein